MIASATLGACGGDDDGATDAGMDAIIGPMPPPLDAGMEEDTGVDAEMIGPMPAPLDAGDDEDAGMDAGPIGPMPDAGPIPPMPPPMPPPEE